MTQTGYNRITKALASLSADEADMVLLSMVNLRLTKVTEGPYLLAQELAIAYLDKRREVADQETQTQ